MRRWLLAGCVLTLVACSSSGPREVPEQYRQPIKQAADTCPELSAKLLAAQIDQESGFDPKAESHAGAQGIAQFVPETWSRWGQDLDGDGVADPFNAKEAIDAQARLMCYLILTAKASEISGDPVELALAGYNAGWSQVEKYDGIPPFKETKGYVSTIRKREGTYVFRG